MKGSRNEISLVRVKALTGNNYLGDQTMENLKRQAEIFIPDRKGSVLCNPEVCLVVCWEIRRLDFEFYLWY